MERVERTIQKRLTGALLLFAGSCGVVAAAFVVLSIVGQASSSDGRMGGAARWVLDWSGWICSLAVLATTTVLAWVVRSAMARETNIFAATSLATFNLLLVVGLFGMTLLGQHEASAAGGATPGGTVALVRPAATPCTAPLGADGRCPPDARRAVAVSR